MDNKEQINFDDAKKISDGLKNLSNEFFSQIQNIDDKSMNAGEMKRVNKMMQDTFTQMIMQDPMSLWNTQVKLWQEYTNIWQNTMFGYLSPDEESQDKTTDRRFSSDEWTKQPFFNFIKQCYLTTSKELNDKITNIEGLDDQTAKEVEFYTQQYINAMSPTNFVMTNPDVIKETFNSKGENLVKGFENMLADIKRNDGSGVLNIKMTDLSQFKIGENIAITPGKVVFENRIFQLIQYSPQTKTVYEKPLLIIPPFINKYYILDLNEKKSFVNWVVQQGYTVFMISWVNPDASYRDTEFEDYMLQGIIPAAEVVQRITEQEDMNIIGYCVGGSLLSATLSYLQQKKRKLFISATYFTCMIDFTEPGELGIFLSEKQVEEIEADMKKVGYLDGRKLAATFNLLRSNDLVWSYFVNNYLCGKEPFPFDILYWNTDSTNMAYKSHAYYLRKMYIENKLMKPNGLTFDGVGIDVSKVDTPSIFISAEKDHIAPWKSTYSGAKLLSGDIEFVLSGSGHIAGIVNPPDRNKYGYKTNSKLYGTAEEWYDSSIEHKGSWWPYWEKYLAKKSGKKINAIEPGNGNVEIIADAPGRYVMKSILNK